MLETLEIVIARSDRRTLSLHVVPNGTLLVKAPFHVSERQIQIFVHEHRDWIEKNLTIIKKTQQKERKEDEYLFLGNTLRLSLGDCTTISASGDKLLFPKALLFRKEKELTTWYTNQAKKIITKQAEAYAKEMQAHYRAITFSDTKSQWGRCTRDNRLQFNWRLVMAPLLVINSVIVHELTHTIEKNHTWAFWAKVRRFNPSYRQQVKWLKSYGSTLQVKR